MRILQITDAELEFMNVLFMRAGRTLVRQNDAKEGTLLHKAAELKGPSVGRLILFLLKRGCDPNAARSSDGEQPLHVAGLACNAVVARELLKAGAQPNAKDKLGNGVLHLMFNVKGTPPNKFPPLECLLDSMETQRMKTAFEVGFRLFCLTCRRVYQELMNVRVQIVRRGARLDVPNAANVTPLVGLGDKVCALLKPAAQEWKALAEPESAAKWSKMFPCEPTSSWDDSESLPNCQICERKFNLMHPKKRCQFCTRLVRRAPLLVAVCGIVHRRHLTETLSLRRQVCDACAKKKFSLPVDKKIEKKRVDDGCFNFLCHRSM